MSKQILVSIPIALVLILGSIPLALVLILGSIPLALVLILVLTIMRAPIFLYVFACILKDFVLAGQFLYMKCTLQYVNGHAAVDLRRQFHSTYDFGPGY